MDRRFRAFVLSCLVLVVTACGGDGPGPVVVALQPHKDPDRMLAERERLASFLSERIDREADVVVPSSSLVIVEGLRGGTIDIAYLSSSDLARNRDAAMLLLAGEIDGRTDYESFWVTTDEYDHDSVEDLRGRPVAFASRTSTSGFVIPLWYLRQQGLIGPDGRPEDHFGEGNVLYGTGYVSAIEKVLAGEAEAAAVSAYVIEGNEHLDETVRARMRVVDRQGPVPTHVIAARATLDAPTREALRDALLALGAAEHRDLREALFVSRLVEVDADEHLGDLGPAIEFAESITD